MREWGASIGVCGKNWALWIIYLEVRKVKGKVPKRRDVERAEKTPSEKLEKI